MEGRVVTRQDVARLRSQIADCEAMLVGGGERMSAALHATLDVVAANDRHSDWAINRNRLVAALSEALGGAA